MPDFCWTLLQFTDVIQIQIHPSQRLHLDDQRQATSLLYSVRLLKQKCFETSLERRLIR